MKKVITTIIILITAYVIIKIPSYAQSPTDQTQDDATIREKVKEKVESIRSTHKAYIGTVTDKTEDSLQVKNLEGEIQLISVDADIVSFAKVNKSTTNIKYSDVAIGDFIVAMGTKNGNGVLTAKRILVTDPLENPNRIIIFGAVTNIIKKEITIKGFDETEQIFTFPARWKGPEIKEVSSNDQVILVAVEDEGKEIIRTIQIVSTQSPTPEE